MAHMRVSKAKFLEQFRLMIVAIEEDDYIKEKISPYNVDLNQLRDQYNAAVEAESHTNLKHGEQLEAKEIAKARFNEAKDLFLKDKKFLQLSLKYHKEAARKLILTGQWKDRSITARSKNMREVYDRVLKDDSIIQLTSKHGLTKEVLTQGRQKIIESIQTWDHHTIKKGEAYDALQVRDKAFEQVTDQMEQIKLLCVNQLKDRPKLLVKLGIRA